MHRSDDRTDDEKRARVQSNKWWCAAPDVCTALWDDLAWYKWITKAGGWTDQGNDNFGDQETGQG